MANKKPKIDVARKLDEIRLKAAGPPLCPNCNHPYSGYRRSVTEQFIHPNGAMCQITTREE
jgi:hypothetical protein